MSFNSSSWDNMISFMNAGSDDNYGASVPGDAISLFSYNKFIKLTKPVYYSIFVYLQLNIIKSNNEQNNFG